MIDIGFINFFNFKIIIKTYEDLVKINHYIINHLIQFIINIINLIK